MNQTPIIGDGFHSLTSCPEEILLPLEATTKATTVNASPTLVPPRGPPKGRTR